MFAWYIPSVHKDPAPGIVILHGWGGNAESMLAFAPGLHRAGYALLFLDARNHGQSDCDDFSSLVKFAEDLDHGLDWLKNKPGIQADRLGILGHSVGAAAAILVASHRHDLSAVVSIAAFAHPELFMRRYIKAHHIPYVPVGWWVLRYIESQIKARFEQIAPVNTIQKVTCPILLVHGALDIHVPIEDVNTIYKNRSTNEVQLKIFTDVAHTSMDKIEQYADQLIGFFNDNNGMNLNPGIIS